MQTCPVCGQSNPGLLCSNCGFDESQNYIAHATFVPITDGTKALSAYQSDWARQKEELLHCDSCGHRKFEINTATRQICCAGCGKALSSSRLKALRTFPGLEPAPESKQVPTPPPVHSQSEADFQILGSKLVKYLGSASEPVIPTGITKIGDAAFKGNLHIRSVQIPDSVQEIEANAFCGCENLVWVQFPNGIRRLEGGAFQYCKRLRQATLPASLQHIGGYAFDGCESLISIHIPYGIYKIDFATFRNCTALKKVTVPGTVMFVSANAFEGCIRLERIVIQDGVSSIRPLAFKGCVGLQDIYIPDTVNWLPVKTFEGCRLAMENFKASPEWMDTHAEMLKNVIDWSQRSV